jgi:hypothetical protein
MPEVNARRHEVDPGADLRQAFSRFSAWNSQAGSPRILLFWNRELSDETTTRYKDRERGSAVVVTHPGAAVSAYEHVRERQRTTGGAYADIHPADSSTYETNYVSAFLGAGASVLDRSALMRKVSTAQGKDDRSDQQFVEALALEQGVEYLVEVLPQHDAGSTTGYVFQVKITHLPSSVVRAQFRTTAAPPPGPERLVAMPGGFERHRDSRNTPEGVADQLAAETMTRFF